MNYINYGYDSQRALDSAFNSLSFTNEEHNKDGCNRNNMTHQPNNNNNNNNNNSNDKNRNNLASIHPNTFGYQSNNIPYSNSNANTNRNTNNESSNNNNNNDNSNNNIISALRLDLQIKETQIQALENEIQTYKTLINNELENRNHEGFKHNNSLLDDINEDEDTDADRDNDDVDGDDEETLNKVIIPENVETILTTLSTRLNETQIKLKDTEDNLESILTAIALNPSNGVTKDGRYDVETIAHKMVVRLEILTKENKEMAKMLSYGKSKEIHIELNLVQRENEELKAKIKMLEDKIETLSKK